MPVWPIPVQYDGDEPAFLRDAKHIARPPVDVEFTAANTDVTVSHDLDRVPLGILEVKRSGNIVVYDGSVEWTAEAITLRASAAGTVRIFVF